MLACHEMCIRDRDFKFETGYITEKNFMTFENYVGKLKIDEVLFTTLLSKSNLFRHDSSC